MSERMAGEEDQAIILGILYGALYRLGDGDKRPLGYLHPLKHGLVIRSPATNKLYAVKLEELPGRSEPSLL